ncbi:DUF3857 domain-containing protein [Hymenobacter sp. 5317J-9]|uniref:DUF3857 domain-containing protein n=1 Tax=Hymenobacter sp. 5317J-9 TaxID=2932250 RepID=UPI001FD67F6A|nr:DUF3857 domain-containing protein [Hymenobacter sp. 5317J-9]UOQ98895.1 DUF3857 domain-containing protein [Hymenobacter sp. 5317J-9]
MRPFLLALFLLIFAASVPAQTLPPDLVHAGYNWDVSRKTRLPVSKEEADLPAIILRDFTSLEYYYDKAQKGLRLFTTEHRIVRVNSSDGIERFNKIVVPVLESGAPVDIKARTISPRGEVHEVKAADMKELKDQEGGRGFRVFAVDGVEKGSEVEYFYTRERNFNHFGYEVLQTETDARDVVFELISPEALTFEARVYHGPAVTVDTTMAGHRALRLVLKSVPALREEAFANVQAQRMRVHYKLAYMANKGQVRQFTWADASQFVYRNMTSLSKDDVKAVAKVLAVAKLPTAGPLPERIAAAENYVKLNFNLDENASPALAQVVATHNAPEGGFVHLLAAIYRTLGIDYELVVTSSRATNPFDGTFDTWDYLDNFALYFPGTGQYLAPGRPDYRYGMLPAEWTANSGLFIKGVTLGTIESAVGKVKEIPALDADKSPQNIDITVAFSPDLSNSTLQLRQTLGGYPALQIQPFWAMIPEAKRAELMQQLQKGVVADATNFQKTTVRNVERGISPLDKPFIIEGQLDSPSLLDKAGPRYLFKIGTLLGPQTELYQKEERQFDVENDNNRRYLRTIRFDVPAGYTVRNLNDLNVDVKAGGDAAKPDYDFKSSYVQQGQTVTVTVDENYRQIRWPKADFESFRAVVNASANWNKVVLVLDKKS